MKKIIYLFSAVGIVTVLAAWFFKIYTFNEEFDKTAFVSQIKIIQLLQKKQYDNLQSLFIKIQNDFEQGNIEDIHLQYAYRAFRNSNPEFEQLFQQWLTLNPNSWVARMAYATYENNRAWRYRGGQYANKTNKEQFTNMENHFEISNNLLVEALTLKPDLLPAY